MPHVDKKRVAKNSIVLYVRVIISMILSLWSTRLVLKGLGVEDFGIYNVVGGIVVMFGVLTNSLSAANSRFLTFELGKNNLTNLQKTFSTTIWIQASLALLILVICETFGLWFLNNKMNIPQSQMIAANWVYQFSICSFTIDLISVPYNSLIIAHERMKTFAYVGISGSLAKLLIAWVVLYSNTNRLILYGALLLGVSVAIRLFYGFYCKKHFPETRKCAVFEKKLFKDIFSFAGWNFVGATAGVFRDQGVNVVLNVFFGPIVNASRGIANQVSAAATIFAENFMVALRPQITKSYAAREYSQSLDLVYMGSKMGYFLMFIIALPIIAETPYILSLWLGEVPEYTVIFVRLIMLNAMVDVYSSSLMTIMLAQGEIRLYQLVVGGCNLLILPIVYIFLKLGCPPPSVYIVSIAVSIVALFLRLVMAKHMTGLNIGYFVNKVVGVSLLTSIVAALPVIVYKSSFYCEGILNLLIVSLICLGCSLLSIYCIGLSRSERAYVVRGVLTLKNKFKR